MAGDEQVALGLIVSADGDIVTKASELPESITCRLTDGRVLKGSVAGKSFAHDLAVVKVDAKGLPVAEWSNRVAQSGMILASIGPRGKSFISLGVVGSPILNVPSEKGTLEIDVEGVRPGTAGVAIKRVPATAKILQSNDIVTHVDGHATLSVGEFKEWMQWFLASDQAIAGERIALGVQREGKNIVVKVRLESSAPGMRMPRWDRDLEGRHTGFPAVFIHDALVRQPRPKDIFSSFVARTDLGGPVVDCEGKIVGINIGSHSGVFSYAIPAPIIRKVVEDVRAK
jgi:serine protease Do